MSVFVSVFVSVFEFVSISVFVSVYISVPASLFDVAVTDLFLIDVEVGAIEDKILTVVQKQSLEI